MTSTNTHPTRRRLRRLAAALGVAVALAIAVVVVIVLLPSMRERLLLDVISRSSSAMPGTIQAENVAWPSLGTIELTSLSWSDGDTTLARVDHVCATLRIAPLLRRDVDITNLDVSGVAADIPAILSRMPAAGDTPPDDARGGSRFPRAGSVPGLPSIAVRSLTLTADSVRVGARDVIRRVDVAARFAALHGQPPEARVDRLSANGGLRRWGVEEMQLDVDLARGVVDGSARGRIAEAWPFVLRLASDGPDRFAITLAQGDDHSPPDAPGARVAVTLDRDGATLRGAAVTAELRTPGTKELARDSSLADFANTLPDLDGLAAVVSANIAFEPSLWLDAEADFHAQPLVENGRVELSMRDGVVAVPAMMLDLDGLAVEALGRLASDSLAMDVRARCTGSRWLRLLRPDGELPEPLSAEVAASITRDAAGSPFHVLLDAEGTIGKAEVHSFAADARIAATTTSPSSASLSIAVNDYHIATTVAVTRGDEIVARIAPIAIATRALPRPSPTPGADAATLRYQSSSGAVEVAGLRVTGAPGEMVVDASLDESRRGRFDARIDWPVAPGVLLAALDLDSAGTASIEESWRSDGPFHLVVEGTADLSGDTPHVVSTAAAVLPGPSTLRALLPDSARVSDLGPLTGNAIVRVGTNANPGVVSARLDLGSTAWVDTALASVRVDTNGVWFDTLVVAIDTTSIRARGLVATNRLDMTANLRLPDASFIQRFVPNAPAMALNGRAHVSGSLDQPEVEAYMAGNAAGVTVDAAGRIGQEGLALRVVAPDGVVTPRIRLDRVELSAFTPARSGTFPIRVTLNAYGPDVSLRQSAVVDTARGIGVRVDTLDVSVAGRDLVAQRPFTVTLASDSTAVSVDGLELVGTLGRIMALGVAGPTHSDFDATVELNVPDKPGSINLPDRLWPESVGATFSAKGNDNRHATVTVEGITLADGRQPDAHATLSSTADGIRATLFVTHVADTIVKAAASVPGEVSLYPIAFRPGEGSIDARLDVAGLPMEVGSDDRIVRVNANLSASGPADGPELGGRADVWFDGWPRLDDHHVRVAGGAGPERDRADARVILYGPSREVLAEATVRYPAYPSLSPPSLVHSTDDNMFLSVKSNDLDLNPLEPLLPPDMSLQGTLSLLLEAYGPPENPALDGRITTKDVEASVAQRLRLISSGEVTIGGTLKEPSARGEFVIDNGLIRIPDPPKQLHPTQGTALLLPDSVPADTTFADTRRRAEVVSEGEVDVTVRIPSGLWIRGQGLDAELAGELRIRQHGGRPTLTGELRAVRGTLILLGRSFQLDRGSVVFYGDDEANPSLDVQLVTNVGGVIARVTLAGTALEPELTLTSEPEMEEGDIMSYLVFGRPLDDLDQDQVNLVERRATEVAAAMGAVKLQEGLSRQLGIDMVTIRSGRAEDEGSAIVVGKYLSPRLLIKYERLLEEQAAQFINLEYFLTRRLKIETLYGAQDRQGIEVEWSNEY